MNGPLRLRRLTARDLPALQELLEADPGYTMRVTGEAPQPNAAADLLVGRPPGLPPDQKVVLGAFGEDGLVAVIDVLRGWPNPVSVHIGLLQVRASGKRQGVGRRAHDLLLARVADWTEVTTLRAAIVGSNAAEAEPFWAALGYQPTGEPTRYQAGATTTDATVWTRSVHSKNPAPSTAQFPRRTR
ncbi:hypothetical protein SAMN04487968_11514 [Nocardioides terrae]|uniref:N-acetyltransferase domain-containing protein n=1 Tax=Nocardioides terrae TaxID=574651 RepID=A0A1I1N7D3_9ACTN|nr:GNAT family N-acetyltransferase [Nocardioides terrae]SFC93539.1 hypothetical protein SAMN04487968_11514 [Nocardioides terrae]